MSTQQAISHITGNKFGNGTGVSINTTTTTEDGVRKSHSSIQIKTDTIPETQSTLEEWLKNIRLSRIFKTLVDFGAEDIEDLRDLDDDDFTSLQLKKLEMKRLKRAIEKLE